MGQKVVTGNGVEGHRFHGFTRNVFMNRTKSGFTWIELLVVIIIIAVLSLLLLSGLNRRHGDYPSLCQSTLKRWGQVLSMYADESPEQKYPYLDIDQKTRKQKSSENIGCHAPLSIPQLELLYPSLTGDFALLYCPLQPERDNYIETIKKNGVKGLYEKYQGYHFSYVYFGWVFRFTLISTAEQLF